MVLSVFCFVIIGWSWDRPIVMRFIRICFDHFSSFFSFIFLAAQSLCESPCGLASSKRFCWLKALKSIHELTNCTVKGWLMVLVMWIQKKSPLHNWVEMSKIILFEAFCWFKVENNFSIRLVLGPMLFYVCYNALFFKPLFSFFKG